MSSLFSFSGQRPSVIFEEVIVGPGVTNNKLSRNARITMTDNRFGRFHVTASQPALNFLVIGNVHGAMLSHNTLGA